MGSSPTPSTMTLHIVVFPHKNVLVDTTETKHYLRRINRPLSKGMLEQALEVVTPVYGFSRRKDSIDSFIKPSYEETSLRIKKYLLENKSRYTSRSVFKFLRCLSENTQFKTMLSEFYRENCTRSIGSSLGLSQKQAYRLIKLCNIELENRKSSKIHLRLKPKIENILGKSSISEYPIRIEKEVFIVDEYFPELNLAVEIDGPWCHDASRDRIRDQKLLSIGIRTIRISTSVTEEQLSLLLQED